MKKYKDFIDEAKMTIQGFPKGHSDKYRGIATYSFTSPAGNKENLIRTFPNSMKPTVDKEELKKLGKDLLKKLKADKTIDQSTIKIMFPWEKKHRKLFDKITPSTKR